MNGVVRFDIGRKKNVIGHDEYGKIILSRNSTEPGYYKLCNIEEREKVVLADTERVPYDYFPGITYEEFLEVLKHNDFKIGFIEDFHFVFGDHASDDHLVFAYNLETKIVIVAESWNNGECFDRIYVYCPGMNSYHVMSRLLSWGHEQLSVFNLVFADINNKNLGVIHLLKKNMVDIVEQKKNVYGDFCLKLWNHSEKMNTTNDYTESIKKIKRANREDMLKLFGQNKVVMEALK